MAKKGFNRLVPAFPTCAVKAIKQGDHVISLVLSLAPNVVEGTFSTGNNSVDALVASTYGETVTPDTEEIRLALATIASMSDKDMIAMVAKVSKEVISFYVKELNRIGCGVPTSQEALVKQAKKGLVKAFTKSSVDDYLSIVFNPHVTVFGPDILKNAPYGVLSPRDFEAEEEAKIKAEEEAKIKAEEEAKIKAEEEAKIKAEEEAKIKAGSEITPVMDPTKKLEDNPKPSRSRSRK